MPSVPLLDMMKAMAAGESEAALDMLARAPGLAQARLEVGASRQAAKDYFLDAITHYAYADDTALHIAAAAYQLEIVKTLLARGADVRARNRRGAEPLHYAADGMPGSAAWNPRRQAAVITCLIQAEADPNALDDSGVAPIHRAVRTRCSAAVQALIAGGADPRLETKSGSTPMDLAVKTTGRGGSGSVEAKDEQMKIIALLERLS